MPKLRDSLTSTTFPSSGDPTLDVSNRVVSRAIIDNHDLPGPGQIHKGRLEARAQVGERRDLVEAGNDDRQHP